MVMGAALALSAGACGGSSGTTGTAGSGGPGAAGNSGAGTAGTTGSTGTAGDSGAGTAGTTGSTGTAGTTGSTGTAGTTGSTGTAGTTGTGTAGRGGTTGTAGTTGTGTAGRGGTTGTAGAAGTSSSGTAGTGGPITCDTGGAGGGGGTAAPACQAPIAITTGTAATVAVNLGTTRSTVSPDLMGIHTSVYDNNMQLCSTPPLLKAAGVSSLRYPGGSYADLYHWELNTGTWTPASGGGSNTIYIAPYTDFGNFIAFMARVGANALVTVNYGMNSAGTGPGRPQEAAAWVAYANGSTTSTTSIGVDADGKDWKTVGYWASLRAATPLATDTDNLNFLRIGHAAPIGIKYWEIGNEIYGNGYYYGSCGWEADMHVAYPATGTTCPAGRMANSMLSPTTYGNGVKAFSIAMKAVDSTIKVGGIVAWPTQTQYQTWNAMVLTAACANMDFAVEHWYAGKTLAALPTVPETDIPMMFSQLHTTLSTAGYNCPANIPIAVTEWGPNTNSGNVVIPASTPTGAPVGSQLVGLFAAESYANFMEQGALAVHWLELHNNSYLAGIDLTNDPFTTANDSPRWGYHGQLIAHYLASGNDKMVQATVTGSGIKGHASLHADGSVSVMITNTNAAAANVTVSVSGGSTTLGCVGTRYAYTPVNTDQDGTVTSAPIFASSDGLSVPVGVPAYSTVVVSFPKK